MFEIDIHPASYDDPAPVTITEKPTRGGVVRQFRTDRYTVRRNWSSLGWVWTRSGPYIRADGGVYSSGLRGSVDVVQAHVPLDVLGEWLAQARVEGNRAVVSLGGLLSEIAEVVGNASR